MKEWREHLDPKRPGRLFTPDISRSVDYPGERMSDGRPVMWLNPDDQALIAGWQRGQQFDITDQNTGTRWLVRPAACGAACFCGAFAEPIPVPQKDESG